MTRSKNTPYDTPSELLILFMVIWPLIGLMIDFDVFARCPAQLPSCSGDLVARIIILSPLWIAGFIIGYRYIAQYRKNSLVRIVAATVSAFVLMLLAGYWYSIVQFLGYRVAL